MTSLRYPDDDPLFSSTLAREPESGPIYPTRCPQCNADLSSPTWHNGHTVIATYRTLGRWPQLLTTLTPAGELVMGGGSELVEACCVGCKRRLREVDQS